jgi:hypothetical protein
MLAVAIHGQSPFEAATGGMFPTGLESGAFAVWMFVSKHLCACLTGDCAGVVLRAVINHEHSWNEIPNSPDDLSNTCRFVQAGNHYGTIGRPVHTRKLRQLHRPPSFFTHFRVGYFPIVSE